MSTGFSMCNERRSCANDSRLTLRTSENMEILGNTEGKWRMDFRSKCLILLVSAMGFEPMTY